MSAKSTTIQTMSTREVLALIQNRPDFLPSLDKMLTETKEIKQIRLFLLGSYFTLIKEKTEYPIPGTPFNLIKKVPVFAILKLKIILDKWMSEFDFQYTVIHPAFGEMLVNRYKTIKPINRVNEFTFGEHSYSIVVLSDIKLKIFIGKSKTQKLKKWGEIRKFANSAIR